MTRNKFLIAGLLGLALAGSAQADSMIDATQTETLTQAFRGYGSAELGKSNNGDPQITGRIDGTRYGVYFYGCENGKNCREIQLAAGWSGTSVSREEINTWNRDKRYCKTYIDREGDPMLELDINLRFGVSRKNLDDTIEYWQICLSDYKREVLGQ